MVILGIRDELEINENTENINDAVYDLYEDKRETLAFNESGNKQGYEDRLDDTDFFTPEDFLAIYSVKGFTDEQVIAMCENGGLL
tara:strand:- start:223 stop:477 length:255 start_codon:yes stop_codon:yes gene_type:complete